MKFKNKQRFESNHKPEFDLRPNKNLGQHFLRDEGVLNAIVQAANQIVLANKLPKTCIEIGPGEGVLTKKLLLDGWEVLALEKDARSVQGLRATLANQHPGALTVVETDVLKWDPASAPAVSLCIGNIPYYITSDILLWFAKNSQKYAGGVFMVQKEVADRIPSPPGSKDYGRLSVRMQLMFSCRRLFVVPASAFMPPPKVDSAVIEMLPTGFRFGGESEDRIFDSFTATLFSARRKMLRRVLASTLESLFREKPDKVELFWNEALKLGVFPETRPDAISPQAILALHELLKQLRF